MSSRVFPSTGEKPKFDPNAAYEVVKEATAAKGNKPAFNPNKKFEVISDHQPVQQDIAQYEQSQQLKQEQPIFKPMTDWLAIPMASDKTIDEHNTKTVESTERIKAHLNDINNSVRNLLYEHKKDLSGRLKSQQLAVNPREAGLVNYQAQQLAQTEKQDIHVSPIEVESFKSEIPNNPVLLRRSLNQKVKDLTKSNPSEANTLKGDIYRVDRQNNPEKENKIAQNIEKINKGELDYDIVNGKLIKREGFFASLATGYKEKVQAYDDYGVYKSGDEKAILALINKRLKDDPDDATPVSEEGWITQPLAEGARMVGGQPLKPLIGGGVAGYFAGPQAGAAAAAAISAPEMYKLTFGSVLPHNYAAIKKQHPDLSDSETLQQAVNLTNDQANTDALSAAAMGALGAKAGFAPTGLKAGLLQKSLGSALTQIGQTAAKKTLEGLGVGSIGAAGQVVKNLLAQNAGIPVDVGEGIKEQLISGVGMTMGMTILAKFPEVIKPKTYNQLLQAFKGVPKESIETELNNLQQSGQITPEQGQQTQAALKGHADIDNSIKPNIPESDRLKVQEKIKKRNELEASLETYDKAYHPDIKEQIKALNEEIVNLSNGKERGELQNLVDQEHKAGNLQEFTTQTLRDASENDLKKYFKEISEQVYAGNEESAIKAFGENIVNKAKELYPPKESKISVIQPGEIKQPETITIKPKEDAIQIGGPEAAIMDEAPGSSTQMEQGIPESGEAAIPQEGQQRTTEETGAPTGQEGVGEPPVRPGAPNVYAEYPETQLSFRGLQDVANEFGYEDVKSRERVTDIQERKNAEMTANEWAQNGEYQANVDDLLNRIERREHVPTAKQRLILEQYLANERQKAREIPKNTPEYDQQLIKLQRIKDIGQIARQEAGAALRLPDQGTLPHPITDESSAMVAKMEANSVDKLTDQQKAEVEAQVEKYKKAADDANIKVAALEDQVAKLDAQKEFNKTKSTTKRSKKTAEERTTFRRTEIEAAREALRKLRSGESGLSAVPIIGIRELIAIAPHVKNIMVDLVAQGVDNLQDVISHLHTEFKDVLDGLTEKNIHDIIAGEYNEPGRPLSELQRQVKDLQEEAKLINQLEALENGIEPKSEKAKKERNQKIKALRDKIKDARKEEGSQELNAIKKRNEEQTKKIKEKIAKGQFEKDAKKSIFDRDDIKQRHPQLRKEALDAIAKKEEAQHEFDLALFKDEMSKQSRFRKAIGFLGKLVHTSKAVVSGIDDSAVFVQLGHAMLANPKTGAKTWVKHWREAFNDARFKRELAAIHAGPDWEIIKNSGLEITEPHSAASKQAEEAFEKNLLAGKVKIKGEDYQPWKYTGGIFERAFVSMGNNFRLKLFEERMQMLKDEGKTFESHPKEYKDAARVINELTARGKMPEGLAQASPWITPFIWAPRMMTSTINMLGLSDLALGWKGKGYYQNLTPAQRRFALGQLGRGVAMGAAIMGAAALGGAKVDWDPRSVTFGDIIIGNHHYNVFGRFVPIIKTLVQATLGTRIKGSGQVQDLDSGKWGAKTRLGVVGGFFRGKMTPFAGSMMNLAEGRNYFTNEPFGIKDLPKELLEPMAVRELLKGWDNDGTTSLLTTFLPAFEGIKTSDERDFQKKAEATTQTTSKRSTQTRIKRTIPHKR